MADQELEEKMLALVTSLTSQTSTNKLKWKKTEVKNTYQAAIPKLEQVVRLGRKEVDKAFVGLIDERVSIGIYNNLGELIIEFNTPNPDAIRLYNRVKRGAMGVDKAIDDLLNYLEE